MAKLTVTATILAVILLIATAYAFRTTITTIEITDEPNPRVPLQRCREKIQSQDLSHCRRYITQIGPRLLMLPSGGGGGENSAALRPCCRQIRQIDDECQCEALKQIIWEQQQEGQIQGQEVQQMVQRAQRIPTECNLSVRQCPWRSVWL